MSDFSIHIKGSKRYLLGNEKEFEQWLKNFLEIIEERNGKMYQIVHTPNEEKLKKELAEMHAENAKLGIHISVAPLEKTGKKEIDLSEFHKLKKANRIYFDQRVRADRKYAFQYLLFYSILGVIGFFGLKTLFNLFSN